MATDKRNIKKQNVNANQNKNKKKRKKPKTKWHKIKKVLLIVLIFGLAIGFLVFARYAGLLLKYKMEADKLVDEQGREAFTSSLTTVVFDKEGEELLQLSSDKSSYYLKDVQIPEIVKKIFIATEDRNYYDHSGVDYSAVLRAFLALLKNDGEVTQGGSTITQQLARNIFLSHEVSLERKIKEMFIAWKIEDEYSKTDILEFYINDIYFANGFYGLEAAAKGYFDKSAEQLSISELAFVCSIPNNPSLYDPLVNKENTLKRRDRVLKQIYEQGYIDQTTYQDALNEEIVLNPQTKLVNNYVETFIRYSATLELMKLRGFQFENNFDSEAEEKAYKEQYNEEYSISNQLLFTGGYRIYTTIDTSIQNLLQNTLDENLSLSDETDENGIYSFQGSATCIDNETGYVTAIVGGRTQEGYSGYTLNRAYQSFRQPGSSIKPILVYTPLFEQGYTPEDYMKDEPIEDGPVNSPNVYDGSISLRYAIQTSKNTVAWNCFEELGYRNCIEYLLKMNFSKIVKEDYNNAAMSIGGMTWGVSTYEMASAFSTLENKGVYRNPTCIKRIEDSFGDIILENGKNDANTRKIYDSEATLMMSDTMKDVMTSGTGRKYRPNNAICAAKTGTTNDNKDSWLVGYSSYYTLAVWCGYDMPQKIEGDLRYAAGYTWKEFMEAVHTEKKKKDFESYEKESEEETTAEETTTEETTLEEVTTEQETTTTLSLQETTTKKTEEETTLEEVTTKEETVDSETTQEVENTTKQIETTSREIQTEERTTLPIQIQTTTGINTGNSLREEQTEQVE